MSLPDNGFGADDGKNQRHRIGSLAKLTHKHGKLLLGWVHLLGHHLHLEVHDSENHLGEGRHHSDAQDVSVGCAWVRG